MASGTQKTRICLPGEKPKEVRLRDLGPIISKIACCQCSGAGESSSGGGEPGADTDMQVTYGPAVVENGTVTIPSTVTDNVAGTSAPGADIVFVLPPDTTLTEAQVCAAIANCDFAQTSVVDNEDGTATITDKDGNEVIVCLAPCLFVSEDEGNALVLGGDGGLFVPVAIPSGTDSGKLVITQAEPDAQGNIIVTVVHTNSDGSFQTQTITIPPCEKKVVRTAPDGTTSEGPLDAACFPLFGFQREVDHDGPKDATSCASVRTIDRSLTHTRGHTGGGGSDIDATGWAVTGADYARDTTGVVTTEFTRGAINAVTSEASNNRSTTMAGSGNLSSGGMSVTDSSNLSQAAGSRTSVRSSGSSLVSGALASALSTSGATVSGNVSSSVGANFSTVTGVNDVDAASLDGLVSGNMSGQLATNNSSVVGINSASISVLDSISDATQQATTISGEGLQANALRSIVGGSNQSRTLGPSSRQTCLATDNSETAGDISQVNASGISRAEHEGSQINASLRVLSANTYKSAWGWAAAGPWTTANRTAQIDSIPGNITAEGSFITTALPVAIYVRNSTGKAIPFGKPVALIRGEEMSVRVAKKSDLEDDTVVGIYVAVSPGAHSTFNDRPFGIQKYVLDKDRAPTKELTEEYQALLAALESGTVVELKAIEDAEGGLVATKGRISELKKESAAADQKLLASKDDDDETKYRAIWSSQREFEAKIIEASEAMKPAAKAVADARQAYAKKINSIEAELIPPSRREDRKGWTLMEKDIAPGVKNSDVALLVAAGWKVAEEGKDYSTLVK